MKGIRFNSPIILGYAIICTVFCIADFISNGLIMTFFAANGIGPYQFLTHIFVHNGAAHLFGNMMLLLLVGPNVEEKYGAARLILMMITTALLTAIFSICVLHVGIAGASGEVFMLLVLSTFSQLDSRDTRVPITLILVVIMYLGNEILTGILSADDVSQSAHIIGGIIGLAYGIYFYKKDSKNARKNETYIGDNM